MQDRGCEWGYHVKRFTVIFAQNKGNGNLSYNSTPMVARPHPHVNLQKEGWRITIKNCRSV